LFCSAWACGLVPISQTVAKNKNVLWNRKESIGLHYQGSGCHFHNIDAPKGVEVTVFVEFTSKVCKFCRNGVVVAIQSVPEAEFPLRLGVCGHNGSIFDLKSDKFADFECLMAAKIGDSIFPAPDLTNPQALPFPPQRQARGPASALRGGAAVGGFVASSGKNTKVLECLRLEFSSALEFDHWRRALLHALPTLTIESTQSQQSQQFFDLPTKLDVKSADASIRHLSLPFSFIQDTRCLCEERYTLTMVCYSSRSHSV
jgi:hypothetical protein